MFSNLKSQGTLVNQTYIQKLDLILKELRYQRIEHNTIIRMLEKLTVDDNLQKQVDEYFETPPEDTPEEEIVTDSN